MASQRWLRVTDFMSSQSADAGPHPSLVPARFDIDPTPRCTTMPPPHVSAHLSLPMPNPRMNEANSPATDPQRSGTWRPPDAINCVKYANWASTPGGSRFDGHQPVGEIRAREGEIVVEPARRWPDGPSARAAWPDGPRGGADRAAAALRARSIGSKSAIGPARSR